MTPKPLTYLTLGMAALFLVLPLLLAVLVTLAPQDRPFPSIDSTELSRLSLTNAKEAFTRGRAGISFANSLFIAAASAFLGVAVGFPTAYVLARYPLPLKATILALLLLLRLQLYLDLLLKSL